MKTKQNLKQNVACFQNVSAIESISLIKYGVIYLTSSIEQTKRGDAEKKQHLLWIVEPHTNMVIILQE